MISVYSFSLPFSIENTKSHLGERTQLWKEPLENLVSTGNGASSPSPNRKVRTATASPQSSTRREVAARRFSRAIESIGQSSDWSEMTCGMAFGAISDENKRVPTVGDYNLSQTTCNRNTGK